eukprot:CAMPEP_0180168964 /NCGR_PEP_ID=MMETSP0986-20121125/32985_1 /TAXON_ID=697907 /ORGANISM="non described non described, Strain CCMP2293" /LENGTH=45 /DNA_ID= /DNA_START= /DNA_END= /DNA_ORIENTATION=
MRPEASYLPCASQFGHPTARRFAHVLHCHASASAASTTTRATPSA